MFEKILSLVDPEDRPQGVSLSEIEELDANSKKHFGCNIPNGYKDFLKKANGLSDDGYSIFCYFNDDMKNSFPRYSNLDFISFNSKFVENTGISEYLMIGKSSIDYLAYDKTQKKYIIMTNGIMKKISEADDFEKILEEFFQIL